MCNCYSYNGGFGTEPQVVLDPNEYFDWDSKSKSVFVDACISEQIKKLWEKGIWTRGCCCGHNGKFGNANVILDATEKPAKAINFLKEIDPNRDWDVLQWQLTKCT